jgi:hypothetical protein
MALILAFVPQLNKTPQPLPEIVGFAVAYTAVMLYLGRRKFLRFQVLGAGPGSNVPAADWMIAPHSLRRLLRCTPSGGTLNLVRKELHLLWPLAPLTLIVIGMLAAAAQFRFVSGNGGWVETVAISLLLTCGLSFAAILAGTLSLGEERSLGILGWNMTQPFSVFRQWTIKLVTVVVASTACAGTIVLAAYLLVGPDFLQQFLAAFGRDRGLSSLAGLPLLTFAAFWCATGVNGTVRAVFWCLPAVAAVLVAYDSGMSLAMGDRAVEVVRTVTEAVHPFPFSSGFEVAASRLLWSDRSVVIPALWVISWLVPLAAMQSYRLFRSEIREGLRPLIRQVLVLAGMGFLCGFLQIVPAAANGAMHNNTVMALMEVARGVAAMPNPPSAVTVALSDRTLAWLASDRLVIRPKSEVVKDSVYDPLDEARYLITAELNGGWKCVFADTLFDDRYGVGRMGVPRGANYLFVCRSENGKLGWLDAAP